MDEESIEKKDSEETKGKGVEKISVEVPETDDEAKQAIKNIEQLVDGISKKLNEQQEPEKENEEVEKKDETVRDFFLQSLKKNGAKDEEIEKALKEFDEKFEKKEEVKKEDKKEQEEETTKNVDTSKEVLDVLSDLVQKGKTFTPKRQQALKGTIEKLNQLLQELTSSPSQTPSDSKFGDSGVKKNKEENQVSKSVENLSSSVEEGFKKIAEVVKSLNERIEKIENARPASKSLGDDQTDQKIKKDNNFWKGVPL